MCDSVRCVCGGGRGGGGGGGSGRIKNNKQCGTTLGRHAVHRMDTVTATAG